jgi:hypothetical protein
MADRPTHIVEFDEAELICRMAEAFGNVERPHGRSANEALGMMDPVLLHDWLRVLVAVKGYWDETFFNMKRIQ